MEWPEQGYKRKVLDGFAASVSPVGEEGNIVPTPPPKPKSAGRSEVQTGNTSYWESLCNTPRSLVCSPGSEYTPTPRDEYTPSPTPRAEYTPSPTPRAGDTPGSDYTHTFRAGYTPKADYTPRSEYTPRSDDGTPPREFRESRVEPPTNLIIRIDLEHVADNVKNYIDQILTKVRQLEYKVCNMTRFVDDLLPEHEDCMKRVIIQQSQLDTLNREVKHYRQLQKVGKNTNNESVPKLTEHPEALPVIEDVKYRFGKAVKNLAPKSLDPQVKEAVEERLQPALVSPSPNTPDDKMDEDEIDELKTQAEKNDISISEDVATKLEKFLQLKDVLEQPRQPALVFPSLNTPIDEMDKDAIDKPKTQTKENDILISEDFATKLEKLLQLKDDLEQPLYPALVFPSRNTPDYKIDEDAIDEPNTQAKEKDISISEDVETKIEKLLQLKNALAQPRQPAVEFPSLNTPDDEMDENAIDEPNTQTEVNVVSISEDLATILEKHSPGNNYKSLENVSSDNTLGMSEEETNIHKSANPRAWKSPAKNNLQKPDEVLYDKYSPRSADDKTICKLIKTTELEKKVLGCSSGPLKNNLQKTHGVSYDKYSPRSADDKTICKLIKTTETEKKVVGSADSLQKVLSFEKEVEKQKTSRTTPTPVVNDSIKSFGDFTAIELIKDGNFGLEPSMEKEESYHSLQRQRTPAVYDIIKPLGDKTAMELIKDGNSRLEPPSMERQYLTQEGQVLTYSERQPVLVIEASQDSSVNPNSDRLSSPVMNATLESRVHLKSRVSSPSSSRVSPIIMKSRNATPVSKSNSPILLKLRESPQSVWAKAMLFTPYTKGKTTQSTPRTSSAGAYGMQFTPFAEANATQSAPRTLSAGANATQFTPRTPSAGANSTQFTRRTHFAGAKATVPRTSSVGDNATQSTPRTLSARANATEPRTISVGANTTQSTPRTHSDGANAKKSTSRTPSGANITKSTPRKPDSVNATQFTPRTPSAEANSTQSTPKPPSARANTTKSTPRTPSGANTTQSTPRTPFVGAKTTQSTPRTPSAGADAAQSILRTPSVRANTTQSTPRTPSAEANATEPRTPSAGANTSQATPRTLSGANTTQSTPRTPSAGANATEPRTPSAGVNTSQSTPRTPSAGANATEQRTISVGANTTQSTPRTHSAGGNATQFTLRTPSGANITKSTPRKPDGVNATQFTPRTPSAEANSTQSTPKLPSARANTTKSTPRTPSGAKTTQSTLRKSSAGADAAQSIVRTPSVSANTTQSTPRTPSAGAYATEPRTPSAGANTSQSTPRKPARANATIPRTLSVGANARQSTLRTPSAEANGTEPRTVSVGAKGNELRTVSVETNATHFTPRTPPIETNATQSAQRTSSDGVNAMQLTPRASSAESNATQCIPSTPSEANITKYTPRKPDGAKATQFTPRKSSAGADVTQFTPKSPYAGANATQSTSRTSSARAIATKSSIGVNTTQLTPRTHSTGANTTHSTLRTPSAGANNTQSTPRAHSTTGANTTQSTPRTSPVEANATELKPLSVGANATPSTSRTSSAGAIATKSSIGVNTTQSTPRTHSTRANTTQSTSRTSSVGGNATLFTPPTPSNGDNTTQIPLRTFSAGANATQIPPRTFSAGANATHFTPKTPPVGVNATLSTPITSFTGVNTAQCTPRRLSSGAKATETTVYLKSSKSTPRIKTPELDPVAYNQMVAKIKKLSDNLAKESECQDMKSDKATIDGTLYNDGDMSEKEQRLLAEIEKFVGVDDSAQGSLDAVEPNEADLELIEESPLGKVPYMPSDYLRTRSQQSPFASPSQTNGPPNSVPSLPALSNHHGNSPRLLSKRSQMQRNFYQNKLEVPEHFALPKLKSSPTKSSPSTNNLITKVKASILPDIFKPKDSITYQNTETQEKPPVHRLKNLAQRVTLGKRLLKKEQRRNKSVFPTITLCNEYDLNGHRVGNTNIQPTKPIVPVLPKIKPRLTRKELLRTGTKNRNTLPPICNLNADFERNS